MPDAANKITREQFDEWSRRHRDILSSMKFVPALDRERTMLYIIESMLLRVRLSIGLGDPGTPLPHAPKEEDPEGFREAD